MATHSLAQSAWRRYVLLVEDDVVIAATYRLGLELEGFRVAAVPDATGLFRAIAFEVPDLLVLDWSLPGTNGGEILERIRRDGRTRNLPVVMLSDYPSARDGAIDRAFSFGALAWLQKSETTPADLSQKLREALEVISSQL